MTQTTDQKQKNLSHAHAELQQFWPCLTGKDIARRQEFQAAGRELKALISAPAPLYTALYETTLFQFMEFCQAMPQDMHQPKPYSLLTTALETAVAALKLRRGAMIPWQSNSETIAEQESLWTYAVFTAGLWVRLPDLQADRTIELYKSEQEQLSLWHPFAGNLYEPQTFYKILAKPHPLVIDRLACLTGGLVKIMPSVACRWLSSDQKVWSSWWEIITHTVSARNELAKLMKKILPPAETQTWLAEDIEVVSVAAENPEENTPEQPAEPPEEQPENKDSVVVSVSEPAPPAEQPEDSDPLIEQNPPPEPSFPPESESESEAAHALDDLSQWILRHCSSAGKLNGKNHFLRIQSGLLIRETSLGNFIKENPDYESVELLLNRLDRYLRKESDNTFRYCFAHAQTEETLRGIILLRRHLCEPLKNLPENQFIQNLS